MNNGIPEALTGYDPDRIRTAATKVLGTRWDHYANHDPYFGLWLKIIDTTLAHRIGIGLFDLADAPYRDWYDDGITPTEAAGLALAADDTCTMILG